MNIHQVSTESLTKAAEILRNGGLVAFPTETVYGLGADAFNPNALTRVFEVKGRPRFDPLIIHIASLETLESVAALSLLSEEKRKKLYQLAENFWPGPLSIVLPKNDRIPGIATAGLSTAAIRFPSHDTAQKLISLSTGAVAAPSANPFGSISPTRAEHVRIGLGQKIDMILDGGSTLIGLESTVIDITGEQIKLLRPGGTPKEVIESLIGTVLCPQTDTQNELCPQKEEQLCPQTSPGQLKSHYAPKTPLFALSREEIIGQTYENGSAYLFFDGNTRDSWLKTQNPPDSAVIKVLSGSGHATEAASHLFETLHELDNSSILRIFAQFAPPHGLGIAINDRLKRASV